MDTTLRAIALTGIVGGLFAVGWAFIGIGLGVIDPRNKDVSAAFHLGLAMILVCLGLLIVSS